MTFAMMLFFLFLGRSVSVIAVSQPLAAGELHGQANFDHRSQKLRCNTGWGAPSHFLIPRGGSQTTLEQDVHSETTESSTTTTTTPHCLHPERWSYTKRAIILMDGFAEYHGQYLAQNALEVYGVAVIQVLSTYMNGYFLKTEQNPPDEKTRVMPNTDEETIRWKAQLVPDQVEEIVAVIVESDSGLADGERLAMQVDATYHNGIQEARRNKFIMNEMVSKRGNLATVRQMLCRTSEEAVAFAKSLEIKYKSENDDDIGQLLFESNNDQESIVPHTLGLLGTGLNAPIQSASRPRCIVKPVRGVASDDVFLCENLERVEEAFQTILGSTVFGSPALKHDSVLVQEFAHGTEYAIDVVSRNGHHKVAALWRYDKRPANGRSFVYHATELVDANSEIGRILYDYVKAALDGLDLKWGLTHNEVILTATGPRLVEVNCRQHNMDFCPIAMFCIGYNAFDMLLSAYLGECDPISPNVDSRRLDWVTVPDLPAIRAHGAMVHMVNSAKGVLLGVNEDVLKEITSLESMFDMDIFSSFLNVGSEVEPTIDIRTDAGWIQLMNDDGDVFQRDYKRILELMPQIFIVDTADLL